MSKVGDFNGGELTRLLSQARESAWVSAFLSCAKIAIGGADMPALMTLKVSIHFPVCVVRRAVTCSVKGLQQFAPLQ